jgi:cysteine desulfurase
VGRVYLDHASTSPPRPEVVDAFTAWMGAADPGRVHTEGRMARVALEDARANVAALFGTRPRQVIFTSGGTEAINAAVFGATAPATTAMPGPTAAGAARRILLAAVEHSAVRDASARAAAVTMVGVDGEGHIDPAELLAEVGPETALVHCQWGNHEVATLQPVAEVAAECRRRGVFLHVDAAAAAGHVPINFDELGADLLSVSAHKLGGPKGAGALLVRRGLRFPSLLVGGDQERGRRAGMEDVAAWVGFGEAARTLAEGALELEAVRARAQTAHLLSSVLAIPGVRPFGDTVERLPHLICVGVDGVEAEAVLLGLDQAGVAAHSGSACSSESLEPSPVLAAMGVEAERSLRLSVGWSTTDDDVQRAGEALPAVIDRLRRLASSAG